MVPRRRFQEGKRLRGVKLSEFALGNLGQSLESTRAFALVERLSVFALERLDHAEIVLRGALESKTGGLLRRAPRGVFVKPRQDGFVIQGGPYQATT